MRIIFYLSLIWALTSTAGALQCDACTDPECTSTESVTCDSESMCITASINATEFGNTQQRIYKNCTTSSVCPKTGKHTHAVSLGFLSVFASTQCCNSDNCNSETLPFPSPQPSNDLRCFVCDFPTSKCDTDIPCLGEESKCFTGSVMNGSSEYTVKGCASPNTCERFKILQFLPFLESIGSFSRVPECCNGKLCNRIPAELLPLFPTRDLTTSIATTTTPAFTTTTPQTTISALTTPNLPIRTTTSTTTATVQETTTAAPSLQCVSCTDPECTNTELVTCDSGSMCITASIQGNTSETPVQRIYMGCAPSALCPSTGNRTYSVNLGFSSATASALCCNTSNCNSETLPFPSPQSPNGLLCFGCDPTTSVCDSTVQCSGEETNCFRANVRNGSRTYPVQGCVTPITSETVDSILSFLFLNAFGSITGDMSSCNTSKCIRSPDSPTTTPAPSLQCVSCTDPECTNTELVTCDSESMCITASIQVNLPGTAEQRIYMDCAPSALCPRTGNRNFSVNLGFSSATASALCCNTSNCNSVTLPFPSPQSNNGLKCSVCDPTTSVCDSTVQCSGDENNCFSAEVRNESSTYPVQGCVNSNTFTAADLLLQIPFLESLGSIIGELSSCRSSLCNSPTTQTPSATINIPKPTGEPAQSASSDASSVRLGALYLLLGLVIFPF